MDELEELEEAEERAEAIEPAIGETVAAEPLDELEELEEAEELAEAIEPAIGETVAAEPLDELEELDVIDEVPAPSIDSGVDWGSLSAEALALSADEDEDVPIIPESLGLELVEETDLADVIGYMDKGLNEDQMVPDGAPTYADDEMMHIELTSPFENVSSAAFNFVALMSAGAGTGPATDSIEASASQPATDEETEAPGSDISTYQDADALQPESVDEMLEEVEFDLFLGSLDLSGLDGYRDEEGFLELDSVNFNQLPEAEVDESEYMLDEGTSEISMLSNEQREKIEELQSADTDDGEAAELEQLPDLPYTRSGSGYHRLGFVDSTVVELQALGEDAPVEIAEEPAHDSGSREDHGVIVMVDGVYTIDKEALAGCDAQDPELKALADAVLSSERA